MLAKTINSTEENNAAFTVVGYDSSKYNALKHGILSKHTVMHWENKDDYESLLDSLVSEYKPHNTTEEHLVEELAGIIWRKMRLRYAEKSSLQGMLSGNLDSFANSSAEDALLDNSDEAKYFNVRRAVVANDYENKAELLEIKEYLSCCMKSEQIIEESNSYEKALAALHEVDQEKWQEAWDSDDESDISSATAEGLLSWIDDLKEHYEGRIYELENRDKVKEHTLGKSFFYEKELNKYIRYENHLDKKFEKTLAMLLKLKNLRETNDLE